MALRYYTIFEDRERVAEAVECVLPTRWEITPEQFEKSHWRFQDFHPSFEASLGQLRRGDGVLCGQSGVERFCHGAKLCFRTAGHGSGKTHRVRHASLVKP